MSVREKRRAAALDRIADHMLAHGLADSSLRALAQTAGTSDRMLLYYFAGKDDILVSALGTIATRLGAILHTALGGPCSADPEKVLATILSRCQRFDLRRISSPLISIEPSPGR